MAAQRSELSLRVISAVVLAGFAFLAVWAGGIWFALFASFIALLVFLEWTALSGLSAFTAMRERAAVLMIASMLVLTVFGTVAAFIAVSAAGVAAYFLTVQSTKETAIWTSGAIFYCGFFAVALVGLRNGEQGVFAILLLFAIVWSTDIGAYFIGRKFGGPKLAPKISPGKTQSGAIGGLLVAIMAAVILGFVSGAMGPLEAGLVAAFVSAVSQGGDLFESYLKRRFHVKDSGSIIPGHGGVVDRVDGLMPAALVLFLLCHSL